MSLSKQAKILSKGQLDAVVAYLSTTRNANRNKVIFFLSVKAGLRAKEIALLKWSMLTDAEGKLTDAIHLTDDASKGSSGRVIPINKDLKAAMLKLRAMPHRSQKPSAFVISTERADHTSSYAIVNMFAAWYEEMGFNGASSHSGRRTFITNAARRISTVGGSLRDVQMLAGHSALSTTQRYIEADVQAQKRIVDLV